MINAFETIQSEAFDASTFKHDANDNLIICNHAQFLTISHEGLQHFTNFLKKKTAAMSLILS